MILQDKDLTIAELSELKAKREAQAVFAAMSVATNSVKAAGKKLQEEIASARAVMVGSYNSPFNGVAQAVREADDKLVGSAARKVVDAVAECVQLLESARNAVDNRYSVNVRLPESVRLRPFAQPPAFNLGGAALNAGSIG